MAAIFASEFISSSGIRILPLVWILLLKEGGDGGGFGYSISQFTEKNEHRPVSIRALSSKSDRNNCC